MILSRKVAFVDTVAITKAIPRSVLVISPIENPNIRGTAGAGETDLSFSPEGVASSRFGWTGRIAMQVVCLDTDSLRVVITFQHSARREEHVEISLSCRFPSSMYTIFFY